MQYPFPVSSIADLSEIPEEHLSLLGISLPTNRSHQLSHTPDGELLVFIYEINGEKKGYLYDRIKSVESYLQATKNNYSNDQHKILQVYIVEKH